MYPGKYIDNARLYWLKNIYIKQIKDGKKRERKVGLLFCKSKKSNIGLSDIALACISCNQ